MIDDLEDAFDLNAQNFTTNLAMHTEALNMINQNNIELSLNDSDDVVEALPDSEEGVTPSSHCINGDKLFRLAEYKMRITEEGIVNDADRSNLQLTCDVCKNDIGVGQPSFSCRGICDWDVCSECVKPEIRDSHQLRCDNNHPLRCREIDFSKQR